MYKSQLQLAILYVINTQYHLLNEIYRDRVRYIQTLAKARLRLRI